MRQLSFADLQLNETRRPSRISIKLEKINKIVNWDKVLKLVQVVDKTGEQGGSPHIDLLIKVKMLFLQHLYNLSDPELEDQVNDRLSFQRFSGINFTKTVPDYTTIWRFKEALIGERVMDKLFKLILEEISSKDLLIKKGTLIDATIIESSSKPLSKANRNELEAQPSSQIDTEAHSTKKRGKWYFGYKGHIGVDMGSKIIHSRSFTSAQVHDSQETDKLLRGDEQAIFADSAYSIQADKRKARRKGVYYGILDKGTKKRKLSNKQKKTNRKKSRIRAKVEHPFAYIKERLNFKFTVAKTLLRNQFRFDFNCILYNIFRANYLLQKAKT